MRENIHVEDIDIDRHDPNQEDMNTNYNSTREQLSRDLRRSKNFINRMVIYGNYIRNELFHRRQRPIQRENIANEIIENPNIDNRNSRRLPLKFKVIIVVLSLALLILIGIGLYLYFREPIREPIGHENFVTGLTYEENQIMRFQDVVTRNIFFDFGNMSTPNASQTLIEYFDYVLGISHKEARKENNIRRELFSGFIFLENYMIDNGTNKMLMQNSSLLQEIEIGKTNLRNLQEKKYFNYSLNEILPFCCIDNGTLPILEFTFYRNGKIKRIFKPKTLITLFYDRMVEFLEKIIPKILATDFNNAEYKNLSEGIEQEYEKIKNKTLMEDKEDEEEEEEFQNEEGDSVVESDFRRMEEKIKRTKVYKLRNLENTESNNITNSSIIDGDIEETLNQEFNKEDDFNVYIHENEINDNKENKTNLNYYGHSMVRNDYLEFKGSQQNVSITSIIDEKEKSLKEVHYIHKGILINNTNFLDDVETEREKSCSNDNLLDCNDLANDTEANIINSQINSLEFEVIEDILSKKNYIDDKKVIIEKMKNIFSEYKNNTEIIDYENLNLNQRLLRDIVDYVLANKFEFSDVEIEMDKTNKKRGLNEYNGFYGMNNMEYSKDIFNLNILGLQMKLSLNNYLYINEGKTVIKLNLVFAFIKISVTLKTVRTNMHLAIRNYNEMGFTLLYLINESNNKLALRNSQYDNIIIDSEKEFTKLNINKHDFGNIFKESFNDMYEQIKKFTTEIFEKLIIIIRNAYNNYTEVLQDVLEDKHDVFNEIRVIIKKKG